MLLAVLLGGCSVFSPNWVESRGFAPFEIEPVKTALWVEGGSPNRGYAEGMLFLTASESTSCSDVVDGYDLYDRDSWMWDTSGVVVVFSWDHDPFDSDDDGDDIGWLGDYYSGVRVEERVEGGTAERQFMAVAVTDGTLYLGGYGTYGEAAIERHSAGVVSGRFLTEELKGRFRAEECDADDGDDDDDTGDSGRWGEEAE
ncbi:MAG: hypothetical protein ACOZNI_10080 [Myxococcota bacterium]